MTSWTSDELAARQHVHRIVDRLLDAGAKIKSEKGELVTGKTPGGRIEILPSGKDEILEIKLGTPERPRFADSCSEGVRDAYSKLQEGGP